MLATTTPRPKSTTSRRRCSPTRTIPDGFLDPEGAADALGVSRNTFDRWIPRLMRLGMVEANRLGKRRLFVESTVRAAYLRGGRGRS